MAGCGDGGAGPATDTPRSTAPPTSSSTTSPAPVTTPRPAPPVPTVTWQRGVAYGDDPAQVLDVAVPDPSVPSPTGQQDARPTILFVHGGGWTEGSRDVYEALAAQLASDGWVAATTGYRLAPGTPHPGPADDVRAALAHLVSGMPDLPVDRGRVVVAGDSAGGHLTGLVALGDAGPDVAAWVSWSGVYDLPAVAEEVEGTPAQWLIGRIGAYAGCDDPTAGDCRAAADDASPIGLVSPDDPPTLLLHSRLELVPLQDARAMRDALAAAGVPVHLEVFDGARHGFALLESSAEVVTAFLATTLDLPA